jgi:hypothetical protein
MWSSIGTVIYTYLHLEVHKTPYPSRFSNKMSQGGTGRNCANLSSANHCKMRLAGGDHDECVPVPRGKRSRGLESEAQCPPGFFKSSPRSVPDTKHYAAALKWACDQYMHHPSIHLPQRSKQTDHGDEFMPATGSSVQTDAFMKQQLEQRVASLLHLPPAKRDSFMSRDLYTVGNVGINAAGDSTEAIPAQPAALPEGAPRLEKPEGTSHIRSADLNAKSERLPATYP